MSKKKIASAWLEVCSGCHMSFLDIDERIVPLLEQVELTSMPITDVKEIPKVEIGILSGALGNEEEVEVARKMREQCEILVAWGDCAIMGGINAMRNFMDVEDVLREGFVNSPTTINPEGIIPHEDIPKLLPKVLSLDSEVKVDVYIPGCPPDADTILYVFQELLEGRIPSVPSDMMRYD